MAEYKFTQMNINTVKPLVTSSVGNIDFLLRIWPTLELPALINSNREITNRNQSTEELRRNGFLQELQKYKDLLNGLAEHLTASLKMENTKGKTVAQVFRKYRQAKNIKKPFDNPDIYEKFTLEAILQTQIQQFFVDLTELVNLYVSTNPETYPVQNRDAVVEIRRKIGEKLRYLEYMFNKNNPCLDYTIDTINTTLAFSKKALSTLLEVPENRENLTAEEKVIYERLRQKATSDIYTIVNNALDVFKEVQCQRFNCEAPEEINYVNLFEEFLDKYNFYTNAELGTLEVNNFNSVIIKLRELLYEPIEETLTIENIKEACCPPRTGGYRKKAKTRMQRKTRTKRKTRKHLKN